MKIYVIDDILNLNALYQDFPFCKNKVNAVQRVKGNIPYYTHGTFCTGILGKSLFQYGILNETQITFLSAANSSGQLNMGCFIKTLTYCVKYPANYVSISIGSKRKQDGIQMEAIMKSLTKTIFIGSAANDFQTTYPAALSCVLGVKRSDDRDAPIIQVNENPLDGIEITANLSLFIKYETSKFQELFGRSNSVLAPLLAAYIAQKTWRSSMPLTKDNVLMILRGS